LQERLGINDGSIDMGFGGEVCNAGEPMFVEQPAHQRRVLDIAPHEKDAAILDERF
jgi:hypothetical protein